MSEVYLIGLGSIIVLGIGAQWLAHRLHIPSILLLLVVGFVAGPVTGFLEPDVLLGEDLIFPIVSLAVGIILFEGGLSLRLDELREIGTAVRNLITVGVVTTWALATAAAYYVAGLDLSLSLLVGSLLVVTGPTVIVPLLRHIRPTGRIGSTAKWEGIINDPIGAILAVLVMETILLVNESSLGAAEGLGDALMHAVEGLFLVFFVSLGISITGAVVLVLLLRRRLVPDYLQNSVALMVVVATFVVSDVLQPESGLLTTTLMGIAVANQKYVTVHRIIEFKEDLRVFLIGTLFILLSARLDLASLELLDARAWWFLAALIVVVRPLSVMLSSIGTNLTWKEQAFLSWLAPRGIVAAAVASLFSFRLQDLYPEQAALIVPLVFLVIVGTVAIYGLTIGPLAQWLGLAQPNPQGILIVGAHEWARRIAQMLQAQGLKVLLADANARNVMRARRDGLRAARVNILSEHVMDELDLSGLGRLLALTPNDEVNALAALHFSEVFESTEIYQLATRSEVQRDREGELPMHLRGRPLFGRTITYADLQQRFTDGAEVRLVELTEDYPLAAFQEAYGDEAVPLFILPGADAVQVYTGQELSLEPGQRLIALVGSKDAAAAREALDEALPEEEEA